jgi:hypothetical protein
LPRTYKQKWSHGEVTLKLRRGFHLPWYKTSSYVDFELTIKRTTDGPWPDSFQLAYGKTERLDARPVSEDAWAANGHLPKIEVGKKWKQVYPAKRVTESGFHALRLERLFLSEGNGGGKGGTTYLNNAVLLDFYALPHYAVYIGLVALMLSLLATGAAVFNAIWAVVGNSGAPPA